MAWLSPKLSRSLSLIGIAACAVAATACGSSSSSGSGGSASSGGSAKKLPAVINVGVVGGQSGLYAYVGNQQLAAAKIAVSEINAQGGIDGSKLAIVSRDDAADPSRAIAALQAFSSTNHAAAILGSPDTGGAVAPYAARVQTPLIGVVDGGGPNVTPGGPGTRPLSWVFGVTDDTFGQAQAMVPYANAHCTKVAILHDPTSYGVPAAQATVNAFKSAGAGSKVVVDDTISENWTSSSTPSVAPEVRRVQDSHANCVLAWISPQSAASFLAAAAQSGYTPKVIGADTLDTYPQYGQLAGSAGNGTISMQLKAVINPNAKLTHFLAAFKQATGSATSGYGIFSYDAVYLVADAIKLAHSANPTDVRAALEKISDYPGAVGSISFTPMQHEAVTSTAWTYVQFNSKTGKWMPVAS